MVKKKDEDVISNIRIAVAKIIDKSTHIDAAKTAEAIGKSLGLNERLINYTHVEIRNKLNEEAFKKIAYRERILFLPHCLRNIEKCKAEYTDYGLQCKKCGNCKIKDLIELAEKYKYKGCYITPGGSMVYRIMKEQKPKAVVGVACANEVFLGMDKALELNIPTQGILLAKEGCKNTDVNLDEVEEKLKLVSK